MLRNCPHTHGEQQRAVGAATKLGRGSGAKVEEWKTGAVLSVMLEQTQQMLEKLTDLEDVTRRNNIRVFGSPEDMKETHRHICKTELELPAETNHQIQPAYRAVAQKLRAGVTPMSFGVNFIQFETRD